MAPPAWSIPCSWGHPDVGEQQEPHPGPLPSGLVALESPPGHLQGVPQIPAPREGTGNPTPASPAEQHIWSSHSLGWFPGHTTPSRSPVKSWAKATPVPPLSPLNSPLMVQRGSLRGFSISSGILWEANVGELKPQVLRHSWIFANPGAASTLGSKTSQTCSSHLAQSSQ